MKIRPGGTAGGKVENLSDLAGGRTHESSRACVALNLALAGRGGGRDGRPRDRGVAVSQPVSVVDADRGVKGGGVGNGAPIPCSGAEGGKPPLDIGNNLLAGDETRLRSGDAGGELQQGDVSQFEFTDHGRGEREYR
ncbi:hypothetical protein CXU20_12670 [Akkermansia muciniphila]|nr:hypothetical protein CXU20_12670 [Akkermansia muciniphila]